MTLEYVEFHLSFITLVINTGIDFDHPTINIWLH